MNRKSGISLLDVVIVILIAGVIAALVIPRTRLHRKEQAETDCRIKMLAISDAMMRFFTTSGDTTLLNIDETPTPLDTTEAAEVDEEKEDDEGEEKVKPKLFTDDVDLLKPYLPDTFQFTCPLDGEPYIINARDSLFYSISCPNGHGQIIKGQATWEE